MQRKFQLPFCRFSLIGLFWFLLLDLFNTSAVQAQSWQAGVASAVITPQEPLWMAGYSSRKEPSQGKIQDLFVKALAFRDPAGNQAIIVTADLIGLSYEFTDAVVKEITQRYHLPRESVLLNTSHTHCGPEVRLLRDGTPGITQEYTDKKDKYVEWLKGTYVETVGKALQDLKPAVVTFASAEMSAPFAVCRRVPTPNGIEYHSTPSSYYTGGPRDNTVPVLRVAAPDGKLRAVLFGYACHPITLSIMKFCGDYPGFAQQYVQEEFPGAVAMFMQGCGAQLVPNARFQIEYAQGHGRTLADVVKKALDGPQTPLSGPMHCAYTETPLQFAPLPERSMLERIAKSSGDAAPTSSDVLPSKDKAAALLKRLDAGEKIPMTIQCPLQAVSFGKELLLVGFSGETVVDYSVAVKTEFQGRFVWAAGYCNFVFGYLPSWKILREGNYEGGTSFDDSPYPGPFAEDVESRVLNGVRQVVKAVDGK